jgi:hypothetical protein
MATSTTGPQPSPLKRALAALVGMPVEAVIAQYGTDLRPEEAQMLRNMTAEDIAHIKAMDTMLSKALSEAGGGNGCGCYY